LRYIAGPLPAVWCGLPGAGTLNLHGAMRQIGAPLRGIKALRSAGPAWICAARV